MDAGVPLEEVDIQNVAKKETKEELSNFSVTLGAVKHEGLVSMHCICWHKSEQASYWHTQKPTCGNPIYHEEDILNKQGQPTLKGL